jgi:transcriptional regulator with XRE-family HTH domain
MGDTNFMSSTKVHESFSTENVLFSKQRVVSREQETLADYVRRVREEKGLSLNEVRIQSGYKIANSYISRIENGEVKNVGLEKLRSLAKGLTVSEEEVVAIARGAKTVGDMLLDEVKVLQLYRGLPPDRQDDVLAHLELTFKRHAVKGNGSKNRLIPPGGRRMPSVVKGAGAAQGQEKKRA